VQNLVTAFFKLAKEIGKPMKKLIITAVIASILCTSVFARTKSDIITLQNGDRVTGEILELVHGKLRVRTSSMGTVRIEWDDVVNIESDYDFRFERTDGERLIGRIEESEVLNTITLVGEGTKAQFLEMQDVIRIAPIDYSFWDSIRGSMTFGYSFTKASEVGQLNFGFDATHRTEIRSWSISATTITTAQETEENTQRSNLNLSMTRFRSNRWFNSYLMGFESNDELGLKLRSSLGVEFGRFLRQTSKSELSLLGGLIGTNESLTGSEPTRQNIEGLLGARFSKYQFDDPNVDLSISLLVYPSLTESGRVRAQFDANIRREIITDLFWDLTYYNTYDNDPSAGASSTNDYAIVTSLGWRF
jgi:hypothetical protein